MMDNTMWRESSDGAQVVGEKEVSRRQFLKLAGIAGAAVGLGAGLGTVVGACGEGSEAATATTIGDANTSTSSVTSAPDTSTSVTATGEMGRAMKLGLVTPKTGALAIFAAADDWSMGLVKKTVGDGILLGDKKVHPIEFVVSDTQSDSNRASQVAGDLILNSKVDILLAHGAPDTVNPAADQAETNECPFLASFNPWQAFLFTRNATVDTVYNWTFGHFFGLEQVVNVEVATFDKVSTNKKVALLLPNDADGNTWAQALPEALDPRGYGVTMLQYQPGAEDFTKEISEFKKAGCEIYLSTGTPPEFANFFKQSLQQGFTPKIVYASRAFGTWEMVDSYGPSVVGVMTDAGFHPVWAYTDSLTGMTNQEMADDFLKTTGARWPMIMGTHATQAWAVDVLQRAADPEDKNSIVEAIKATKLMTVIGPIDFTEPVDPAGRHVTANIYKPSWTAIQLVKSDTGELDWAPVAADGTGISADGTPTPMSYS